MKMLSSTIYTHISLYLSLFISISLYLSLFISIYLYLSISKSSRHGRGRGEDELLEAVEVLKWITIIWMIPSGNLLHSY